MWSPIRLCDLVGPADLCRRPLQWTSKFTRKLVTGSLGGEVYALSDLVDHVSLLRDCYEPFGGLNPGKVGLEGCDNISTHLKTKKMIAER